MSDFLPPDVKKMISATPENVRGADIIRAASPSLSTIPLPSHVLRSLTQAGASVHELGLNHGSKTSVYFPLELTGGVCKWVQGEEEYIVWRAAAAACGSERVHVVWQTAQDKIFYLAIKSEELASHDNTWCPFATLLPGMVGASALPVCYTYYADDFAAMMMISDKELQIYRGVRLLARAKAERLSQDQNNAPIIELTPERITQLTPKPWISLSLMEDQARRVLMILLIKGALWVTGIAFCAWVYAGFSMMNVSISSARMDMNRVNPAGEIVKTYADLNSKTLHQELTDFTKVNDELIADDGLLLTYQISKNEVYWRATVRQTISPTNLDHMKAVAIQPNGDTLLVGRGSDPGLFSSGEHE